MTGAQRWHIAFMLLVSVSALAIAFWVCVLWIPHDIISVLLMTAIVLAGLALGPRV